MPLLEPDAFGSVYETLPQEQLIVADSTKLRKRIIELNDPNSETTRRLKYLLQVGAETARVEIERLDNVTKLTAEDFEATIH